MRVLVCGGRQYADARRLRVELDRIHERYNVTLLINGAAPGADLLAEDWARWREIEYVGVPAKWLTHGPKTAGPIRNSYMLKTWKPELGVVFPGGTGTADMRKKLRAAGCPIETIV